ncbi:hypothetical protein GEMRC1_007455 [Eukaryota sp. GEM-RC1]
MEPGHSDSLISFEEENSPFLDALFNQEEFQQELSLLQSFGSNSAILLPLQPLLQDEIVFSATFIRSHIVRISDPFPENIHSFCTPLGVTGYLTEAHVYISTLPTCENPPTSPPDPPPPNTTSSKMRLQLIRSGPMTNHPHHLFLISSPLPEPDFVQPVSSEYLKKKRRITIHDLLLSSPTFFASPSLSDPKVAERRRRSSSIFRINSNISDSNQSDGEGQAELVVQGSFVNFLEKMRSIDMSTLVYRDINVFLSEFISLKYSPDWLSEWLPEVVCRILEKIAPVEVSSLSREGQVSADFLYDCVEKFVFNKLYFKLFPCVFVDDEPFGMPSPLNGPVGCKKITITEANERDAKFAEKLTEIRDVKLKFSHFDVNVDLTRHPLWTDCCAWITDINKWTAPRDKLVCIVNSCKSLLTVLSASSIGLESFGADQFLPCLIVLIIASAPDNFLSNLDYVKIWRPTFKGESSYYFTSCYIAVEYIKTLNLDELREKDAHHHRKTVTQSNQSEAHLKQATSLLIDSHPLDNDPIIDDHINNEAEDLEYDEGILDILNDFSEKFNITLEELQHFDDDDSEAPEFVVRSSIKYLARIARVVSRVQENF